MLNMSPNGHATMLKSVLNCFKASRLLGAGLLAMGLCFAPIPSFAHGDIELPHLGDPTQGVLPKHKEQQLGKAFIQRIRQQVRFVHDPFVLDYIESLGQSLASYTDARNHPFRFYTVLDKSVNAFAGPDSQIAVNTGLIALTRSESELASVMAHEIAHVSQRHIARSYEKANALTIPSIAAALAALALATYDPQAGSAALYSALAGSQQAMTDHIRESEKEADRVGIDILSKAGFDPRGMVTFFELLEQSKQFNAYNIPEFLMTHPLTESRITDAEHRAQEKNPTHRPSSLEYFFVKAKTHLISESSHIDKTKFFRAGSKSSYGHERAAMLYGLITMLIDKQEYDEAKQWLDRMPTEYIGYSPIQILQAWLLKEQGKIAEGVRILEQALKTKPEDSVLSLGLVELYVAQKSFKKAKALLLTQTRLFPERTGLYHWLATVNQRLGNYPQAQLARAEIYYLKGNLTRAINELTKGIKESDSGSSDALKLIARRDALRQLKEDMS